MSVWDETKGRYALRPRWSQETADIAAGLLTLFGILSMLVLSVLEVARVLAL